MPKATINETIADRERRRLRAKLTSYGIAHIDLVPYGVNRIWLGQFVNGKPDCNPTLNWLDSVYNAIEQWRADHKKIA